MEANTHIEIDTSLCGKVIQVKHDYAVVLLHTTQQMRVDTQGLVHGGFVFSAADLAAMTAVNDPNVVLGESTSTFIFPVKVGDVVLCQATVVRNKGKKKEVAVQAYVSDKLVFEGSFTTFVLDAHVLG